MRKLIKGEKLAALPLSISQIRNLVYVFVTCLLVLIGLSWFVLLKYRMDEAVDRQKILFQARAEQVEANLTAVRRMTLRAQGTLERLIEVGVGKPMAQTTSRDWIDHLQKRGERPYVALPISAGREAIPADASIAPLANVLAFMLRVSSVQYQGLENVWLVDLNADRFYVTPRNLPQARETLRNDATYQAFVEGSIARLRSRKLLEQLKAAPGRVVMLEPGYDWVSRTPIVTVATLIHVDGEPRAVFAMDFPLSAIFPEDDDLEDGFFVQTAEGTILRPDSMSRDPLPPAVSQALVKRAHVATNLPTFVGSGLLPSVMVLDGPVDRSGWRAVEVVETGMLWESLRRNTLWLFALTGLTCTLMLAWVRLVDRRIMRPTQTQSLRLQESEVLGRTIIESTGVGLVILDSTNAAVLMENDVSDRITAHAKPGELARFHRAACNALADGERGNTVGRHGKFNFELAHTDETVSYLTVRVVESTYQGKPAKLCAMDDVTAARQSESTLLQAIHDADAANRAKSAFLATMSHEIRTPLNGMLGSIELLEVSALDAAQRDQLEVMQQSAQSLIQIINDVLDFSKIEAGQMALQARPCQIDSLVEDVCRRFAPDAERRSLQLLCVIDPALHAPILLDPLKTEQVLGNLVSNAIKFTEQGKVVVEATTMTEGGRDWLKLRVIDTGIGIAIEDQQRLFAPFVQAEQSDSRRFGGTGLGLSICNRLVGLMNGSIRLVSEPGLGSCFDVRIPMEPVTVTQPADIVQTGLLNDLYIANGLSGLTVGLCSPSRETYHGIEHLLQHYGAVVVRFDSSQPPATPVDVVVCEHGDIHACPDADVVIESNASLLPDTSQTPIRASRYAWRGLVQAILTAAGLELPMPVQRRADSAQGHLALKSLRILLVEDHRVNQVVMRRLLEWLGQRVDVAGDGREALALTASQSYDLILTDLQMPSMDGYELARTMRERGITVPIIAVTASVGPDLQSACQKAGINRCLTKPVRLAALRELIEPLDASPPLPGTEPSLIPKEAMMSLSEYLGEDLAELSEAAAAGDTVRLMRKLHALAGALATLGHASESQACRWLERTIEESGLAGMEEQWIALRTALETLIAQYAGVDLGQPVRRASAPGLPLPDR
ncbi:ATP-binding protein [Cupriavidus metallidurans]|uniref:Sensory/regulatory protein RpfC n=1 Tax=Cupriavidus metallidurans (strain ATCC 43123 / DSM 2839 / NBRC 102507 / CH34) TaxID=266264 RepID=Q1LDF1_CUPMC|nr:ATP-binding protein [Cupriavidus metallidurans]ABF11825.1 two-component sensor response receiver component, histidine kinase [Cupriavidus metallidurans CH34]